MKLTPPQVSLLRELAAGTITVETQDGDWWRHDQVSRQPPRRVNKTVMRLLRERVVQLARRGLEIGVSPKGREVIS